MADDCDNVMRRNKIYRSISDKIRLLDPCFPSSILHREAPCLGGRSLGKKGAGLTMPAFAGLSGNRSPFGLRRALALQNGGKEIFGGSRSGRSEAQGRSVSGWVHIETTTRRRIYRREV